MIHSSQGTIIKATNGDFKGSYTKASLCSGPGYIIEATVVSHRRHTIKATGAFDLPLYLLAFQAKVTGEIIRREFDATGAEQAPAMSTTTKTAKGHLNHFNKSDAKALHTATVDELLTNVKKLTSAGGVPASQLTSLHPSKPNVIEFYADTAKLTESDFKIGDGIRLKTVGNSVFVESLTVITKASANTFASGGTSTLDAMTRNINNAQDDEDDQPAAAYDGDWD